MPTTSGGVLMCACLELTSGCARARVCCMSLPAPTKSLKLFVLLQEHSRACRHCRDCKPVRTVQRDQSKEP